MKISLGSWDFISYNDKKKHQASVDFFFAKSIKKNQLLSFKNSDSYEFYMQFFSGVGDRGIKILGNNEKDYHFYSNTFDEVIIKKLSEYIIDHGVDSIKVPLLSNQGARALKSKFQKYLKDYNFYINLDSVSPIIDKKKFLKKRYSYSRAFNVVKGGRLKFKPIKSFNKEVISLHNKKWGQNRNDNFYKYLRFLNLNDFSKSFGLFDDDKLIGYIQVIFTGNLMHYYYSIYDQSYSGAGSSLISFVIDYFISNKDINIFSFGRGSEHYKYRWATNIIANHSLRGYYASSLPGYHQSK